MEPLLAARLHIKYRGRPRRAMMKTLELHRHKAARKLTIGRNTQNVIYRGDSPSILVRTAAATAY